MFLIFYNSQIRVVLTNKAQQFVSKEDIAAEVFLDEHEWTMWKKRGDPVLHIGNQKSLKDPVKSINLSIFTDLVKWADIFVIAPLDANTLGKISSGICDNLLTCVARAWDLEKPLVFCPAMNTKMFLHPITRKQIEELKDYGYIEIRPISKTLMCGDTGMGAMAEYTTVVDITFAHLNSVKFERQ